MNEKLRNHVNILFAAAPKTAKAEEVKEELLTNLNDKYNDLLANGYDSMAAFHVALSGIGDIDELFKECGGTVRADMPTEPSDSANPVSVAINRMSRMPNASLILLAIVLIAAGIIGPGFFVWGGTRDNLPTLFFTGLTRFMGVISWAAGIGLIIYAIVRNTVRDETSSAENWAPPPPLPVSLNPINSSQITKEEITFKRIVAGTLAILLGVFGVHKFYLGFIGTGLIMLFITVFSLGILSPVPATIGFIEGIVYLAKSDRDFYRDYEIRQRNWF